jgi:aryl-alcohol dehydrogenase-like predicted oxidoreductase
MDKIAAERGAELATIALAWLLTRPGVVAPLASARTVGQLGALLASASMELSPDEVASLDAASSGA